MTICKCAWRTLRSKPWQHCDAGPLTSSSCCVSTIPPLHVQGTGYHVNAAHRVHYTLLLDHCHTRSSHTDLVPLRWRRQTDCCSPAGWGNCTCGHQYHGVHRHLWMDVPSLLDRQMLLLPSQQPSGWLAPPPDQSRLPDLLSPQMIKAPCGARDLCVLAALRMKTVHWLTQKHPQPHLGCSTRGTLPSAGRDMCTCANVHCKHTLLARVACHPGAACLL